MNIVLLWIPVDIITEQSVIIEQLTPGWRKLMSTDIVSMFMMVLKVSRGHILGFYLEAIRCFHGVYWHSYSPACRVCHKPLGLFLWERRHPIPIRAYNKSWYLAVYSFSVPDTPWSLSGACIWAILSMVRWSPSVFNNLLSGLYTRYVEWDTNRYIQIRWVLIT